jgi:hypothetical protein
MQTIRCRPYAQYRRSDKLVLSCARQYALYLAGVFYFILLKTLIMQKFKLSWMALLRNDEHAQLIGELDRLLVYYRRTVAVRKGRRSAAKERAKSREHRGNVNMQSGRKELDIQGVRDELGNLKKQNVQGMQGSREKQDTQKPLPDVAEEQRREQSTYRERTSSSLAVAQVQCGGHRESREGREHEGRSRTRGNPGTQRTEKTQQKRGRHRNIIVSR